VAVRSIKIHRLLALLATTVAMTGLAGTARAAVLPD